jgi:sulfate transport system permease protein
VFSWYRLNTMLAYTRKVGVRMNKTKKAKRVIPGFGLSMGVTISILSIIVLIPLASLVIYTAQMSWSDFIDTVTSERVMASYQVSLITAFIASAINAVMGVVLAWVLVRYKFPGKRIIDGMIELPFALPTAVAGIALTSLTADTGFIGSFFAKFGISIVYTRIGITFALVFIGIPFVVRAVQPVLEKLDPVYEEAAALMGAKGLTIFRKVTFPHIKWAFLYGIVLCAARAMGEFGAVSVLSGHLRGKTNTLPLHIEILFNEFKTVPAFAVSAILVIMAVIILIIRSVIEYKGKKES